MAGRRVCAPLVLTCFVLAVGQKIPGSSQLSSRMIFPITPAADPAALSVQVSKHPEVLATTGKQPIGYHGHASGSKDAHTDKDIVRKHRLQTEAAERDDASLKKPSESIVRTKDLAEKPKVDPAEKQKVDPAESLKKPQEKQKVVDPAAIYAKVSEHPEVLATIGKQPDGYHGHATGSQDKYMDKDIVHKHRLKTEKAERDDTSLKKPRESIVITKEMTMPKKPIVTTKKPIATTTLEPTVSDQFTKLHLALVAWNAMMILGMITVLIKVVKAPLGDALARGVESLEDVSISKAWPSLLVWSAIGMVYICFSKYLTTGYTEGGLGLACQISLIWWHMLACFIIAGTIRLVRPDLMPAVQAGRMTPRGFLTSVAPIGMTYTAYHCLTLICGCVDLPNTGPVTVWLISLVFGMEQISGPSLIPLVFILLGVAGGSAGSLLNETVPSTAFLHITAFILDGLRLVLLKKLVSPSNPLQLDPLSALYYYSGMCSLCCFPFVMFFEGKLLWATLGYAAVTPSLAFMILLMGVVAFSLNYTLLSVLQNVGATSVAMVSVLRDICILGASYVIMHDTNSKTEVLGYLAACLGVKLWDEVKTRPAAFYKAFGVDGETRGEQLPLAQASAPQTTGRPVLSACAADHEF